MTAIYVKPNISNGKAACSYTREMVRNGKRRLRHEHDVANQTMASTRIRRHLHHAVDCWKFLEYLANSERQYSLFYSKWKVGFFWWFFSCIYFATASVSCVVSPFFQPRRPKKKKKWLLDFSFGSTTQLAKVLLWTCLLNSVQYQRTFLNSVQILTFKFIECFQQCKLNGTISWV